MLPARKSHRFSLADVMPSALASLLGQDNPLGLRETRKVVVVLVDGMGAQSLSARAGHARTLAPALTRATTIGAGFPTTTASALATLMTGAAPGEHGLVGYSVLDSANDRVVNQLSGWDDRIDPTTWQRVPTVFQRAANVGMPAFVVGSERYRDSGFTRAVLRGAEYRGGSTIAERVAVTREVLDSTDRALVYLYIPELDSAGHAEGIASQEWTDVLEEVDSQVTTLLAGLRPREGVLVTADHGMLDIPAHSHVLVDDDPALLDGVRFIAGEPRCLQLHLDPQADEGHLTELLDRWRAAENDRGWVASRREAIDAGWFGDHVAAEVEPRIGDILIAARKNVAYYDSRVTVRSGRSMIGQHGSFSPAEIAIPLLRFGSYA